jgi:hypothetical protein
MVLENLILSKINLTQKIKIICFPSYVDFRSSVNAAMFLDLGHTLREEHMQVEWG